MSKQEQNPFEPTVKNGVEYHEAWLFDQRKLDKIVGEQLELIEMLNLSAQQEKAVRNRLRQVVYGACRNAIFMSSDEVAETGASKGLKGDTVGNPTPISAIT